MTARTLALKMAAPVHCTACEWLGRTGELITIANDYSGSLCCPKCRSALIKWIQNEAPAAVQ